MPAALYIDPELLQYGTPTPRQREYIEAINLHGSATAAARHFNVNKNAVIEAVSQVRKKAALRGYSPDHNMRHTVPDGYRVKGVSTLYDREGKLRSQWVKSTEDRDRLQALLREFVVWLARDAQAVYAPAPGPATVNSEILATYLFGDPHFGMRATAGEGGEDFDTDEADRLTRAGIDRLADVTPDAEEALLIVIGDNTHANDSSARTPGHGNQLDMDAGGHNRSMLVSAKAWIYACQRLLAKHQRVKLWFMPGNHDPDAAYALALTMFLYFEREPRITVDLDPSLYRYHLFGKVMIGAHHGHGSKPENLPLLMAVDRPADWGASIVRYVYMGHIHHDSVKEVQGVRVESIRTLAAKDAWHAGQGYRSMRDTRSIVHHKDFGEIERHTCSAAMLAA